MLVTKKEIKIEFMNYGKITIPKGVRTTHQTACGIDENYNFIADLSWIPPHPETDLPQYGLIHDATHSGIDIPRELLEEV